MIAVNIPSHYSHWQDHDSKNQRKNEMESSARFQPNLMPTWCPPTLRTTLHNFFGIAIEAIAKQDNWTGKDFSAGPVENQLYI